MTLLVHNAMFHTQAGTPVQSKLMTSVICTFTLSGHISIFHTLTLYTYIHIYIRLLDFYIMDIKILEILFPYMLVNKKFHTKRSLSNLKQSESSNNEDDVKLTLEKLVAINTLELTVLLTHFLIHKMILFLSLKRKKPLPKKYCNQP